MKNILSLCDAYKLSHPPQYPKGTTCVYSNHTIRGSRIKNADYYVYFGEQYLIKEYLIKRFNEEFFDVPKQQALAPFKRRVKNYVGEMDLSHFDALHDLGYMPVEIKALPEGSRIPLRVPCMTIHNTHPDFYWVTNYLETIMSATRWGAINSATVIDLYASIRDKYMEETCVDMSLRDFLLHDFSYRGMFGNEAAMISGAAFLTRSCGTDIIPAIDFLEEYYNADSDKELIGGSVPATEHSVACAGGKDGEEETLLRLMRDVYPKGILSFVCDTWDYWHFLDVTVRKNADEIKRRNGKLVFRPDSSPKTPLEIICGDKTLADTNSPEYKGSMELLWEIFGGTTNSKGYRVLHPSVGLIYGEAISMDLYERICHTLQSQKFAISNLVVGIGSFSMTYHTRDSLKQAIKATYCEINGVGVEIFKDPKTDDGTKKSAKGLIAVYKNGYDGAYTMMDGVSWKEVNNCELKTVFKDGKLLVDHKLSEIRERLKG